MGSCRWGNQPKVQLALDSPGARYPTRSCGGISSRRRPSAQAISIRIGMGLAIVVRFDRPPFPVAYLSHRSGPSPADEL